jgi:hypothetical protein
MDLTETGYEDVDWIHLTQDRVQQWILKNNNEPTGSIKGEECLDKLNDYQILTEDDSPWS